MKDWKAWLGVAVSAFLLWWVFRGEDLGDILGQVRSADLGWLVVAGAISTTGGLVRAIRWRLLLEPLGVPTSLHARWKALNVGFAVTNLALGRLGEIARPYALSRMTRVSTSGALGTVVLERVLDMVALLLLLTATLLLPAFPRDATMFGQPIGVAVMGATGAGVGVVVLVGALVVRPMLVVRLLRALEQRVPVLGRRRLGDAAESFIAGLDLLKRPVALLKALAWSFVVWIWMAMSFWAAFQAFGIDLGFTAALFTQCVVSAFVALPAAPGFLGTLQTGVLVSLYGIFGVAEADALSLSVGYHLSGYIPVTSLGLFYALSLRLRISAMRAEPEAEGPGIGDSTP
ncbi:MAG: lysylphosphatidylglycerol synthase transmembrane domain-containing protein [Longimicrobiales bacterium]